MGDDDDRFIRHGRHVGAARRAAAHHDGNLRDAFMRHMCLVEEDATEMLLIREDVVLPAEVRATAVDEVDAGQMILLRDLLRPQVLLDRDGVVGATLHCRVVRHTDPRHHTATVATLVHFLFLIPVKVPAGELRELEETRARIHQLLDALARQHLSAAEVQRADVVIGFLGVERDTRLRGLRLRDHAARLHVAHACPQLRHEVVHPLHVLLKGRARRAGKEVQNIGCLHRGPLVVDRVMGVESGVIGAVWLCCRFWWWSRHMGFLVWRCGHRRFGSCGGGRDGGFGGRIAL